MTTQEDILQGWKDDSYNLHRILKIMLKCQRCSAELDRIGGLQITLHSDVEERMKKLAERCSSG